MSAKAPHARPRGIDVEDLLHGERLVATTRLALFVFRGAIMLALAASVPAVETSGRILRITVLPIYLLFCVGVLVWLRRGRASPRVLVLLPHAFNVIDYAFLVVMAAVPTPIDPTFLTQITAMSVAIVLSFSVARVGTAQAVVSTCLACASFLVALHWADRTSVPAVAFVLGSYVASATLALRVVVGLRRRADAALRLGQYTLQERLGAGGMGVVYKAKHRMLRRPTAVKLLQGERPDEATLARFEREVQLTARLTHPNTIAIYDYGRTPDGIFYYAMEYLDGVNLEQLVATYGPQPPERVVHLLLQICGSLGEAHEAGLIHRDIKPANIVVCERGGVGDVVKVLDFGLVKTLSEIGDAGTAGAADDAPIAITRDGAITGTPLYLAPETLRSADSVDARSDLYALGCVGWFLLVGHPVFDGASVVEICSHHLHTAPERPSRRLGRALPADLEEAILACLAKDAKERPADARALADRLAGCACAAGWRDADARRWWRQNRASVAQLAAAKPLAIADTIAVDLNARTDR